jgi:nitroreductase
LPSDHPELPILTFFITVIFFRSAWKYRERAYRYHLLDTGHLTENLALALRSQGFRIGVDEDFHDEAINAALRLDATKEACLAMVPAWSGEAGSRGYDPPQPTALSADLTAASRVAAKEVEYPMIQEIQQSTAVTIRDPGVPLEMEKHLGIEPDISLEISEPEAWPEMTSYPQAVWARRSKRNFVPRPLAGDQFTAMVRILAADDSSYGAGQGLNSGSICVGFLAGHVEGLEPGFYLMGRSWTSVLLIRAGLFMGEMARICLDQEWLANAALHFLFLTNLSVLEATWGPRGYRYAMMAAGRLGQRIYLGATSMGLGCCGIGAFYDLEASRLLGLNEASRLLYLVAAGPVKK